MTALFATVSTRVKKGYLQDFTAVTVIEWRLGWLRESLDISALLDVPAFSSLSNARR